MKSSPKAAKLISSRGFTCFALAFRQHWLIKNVYYTGMCLFPETTLTPGLLNMAVAGSRSHRHDGRCRCCGPSTDTAVHRIFPLLLLGWALLALNPAWSQSFDWQADRGTQPSSGGDIDTLFFQGVWPSSCVPEFVSFEVEGGDIRLNTQSRQGSCAPVNTRFSIRRPLPELAQQSTFYWQHRQDEGEPFRLHGFRLFDFSPAASDLQPESGWWWPEPGGAFDSSGPGTGLTIDQQQGFITVITQSFDDNGNPEWQLSTGELQGEVMYGALIRFYGGQTFTGDYRLPELSSAGDEINIQFSSASTATVWYSQRLGNSIAAPIELRQVSLVRYVMNPPVLQRLLRGSWIMLTETEAEPITLPFSITEFTTDQADGTVELLNNDGETIGLCRVSPIRTESPPSECTLQLTPAGPALTLDNFGYDKIYGIDSSGRRVTLLRYRNR